MTETSEQVTRRRRWLTLAECVAVAGVLIGALGLYLNYADRRDAAAVQASEAAGKARAARIVRLQGTVAGGGERLEVADAGHAIDTLDLTFPTTLGAAAREGVTGGRIEADWFRSALLKATDGGRDDAEGRLPVLVTARWWDGETQRSDRAIYDIGWRTRGGGLLQGRSLTLTGLALRERGGSTARLDALWRAPARD